MEFDPQGLRYFNVATREYSERAVQDIVRRRLEREAKGAANTARQLASTRLRQRSGRLARSIDSRVRISRRKASLEIGVFKGAARRYAAIQDQGTRGRGGSFPTIVPKRAKALAIPVGAALRSDGSAKYRGPRTDRVPMSAIYFKNPSNPNVIGALYSTRALRDHRRAKKPGLPPARWLLVRKTDLRPRRFLTDAGNRAFERLIPKVQADLAVFLLRGRRGRRIA